MSKHSKKAKVVRTPSEESASFSEESDDIELLLPDTSASRKSKAAADRKKNREKAYMEEKRCKFCNEKFVFRYLTDHVKAAHHDKYSPHKSWSDYIATPYNQV